MITVLFFALGDNYGSNCSESGNRNNNDDDDPPFESAGCAFPSLGRFGLCRRVLCRRLCVRRFFYQFKTVVCRDESFFRRNRFVGSVFIREFLRRFDRRGKRRYGFFRVKRCIDGFCRFDDLGKSFT